MEILICLAKDKVDDSIMRVRSKGIAGELLRRLHLEIMMARPQKIMRINKRK